MCDLSIVKYHIVKRHIDRVETQWGTGIARMRRLMREHGLAEPHLEDLDDFSAVTFYGPGDRILDLIPEG